MRHTVLKNGSQRFRASNFEFSASPDLRDFEGRSYGHWLFARPDGRGGAIVNRTYYSNSTVKHQIKGLDCLRTLGIPVSLELRHTTEDLTNLKAALEAEVLGLTARNAALAALISKKGTRKRTNEERKAEMEANAVQIKKLRKLIQREARKGGAA